MCTVLSLQCFLSFHQASRLYCRFPSCPDQRIMYRFTETLFADWTRIENRFFRERNNALNMSKAIGATTGAASVNWFAVLVCVVEDPAIGSLYTPAREFPVRSLFVCCVVLHLAASTGMEALALGLSLLSALGTAHRHGNK